MTLYRKICKFLKINFLFLWTAILALYFIQIGVMLLDPAYGTGDWGSNAWINGIKFVINDTTVAGLNVLFIMIILWLVTIFTNRIPATLILAFVITAIVSIAEFQVISVRQEAITEASLQEISALKIYWLWLTLS